MKKYYLIGENTDNSLSPEIHNWIYRFCNIQATYSSKNIDPSEFDSAVNNIYHDIKSNNINGLNITNPYKSRMTSPSIIISEDSNRINAINCIYKDRNKTIGDNTDWYGFIKSLEYNNINLEKYNIVILGAGGGSRAIMYGLQKLGINFFEIYNRSNIEKININNISYDILDIKDINRINYSDLFIINCLPSNIIDNNPILSENILANTHVFYDLNYHQSKIHTILKSKDIQVINGLDMLIYQAIKSIELWSSREIVKEVNIENIKKYLLESK